MTKWLTEDELRRQWDDSSAETFQLEPGTSVTPAAREFLMDRRAALYGDPKRSSSPNKKPEHMTALRGSVLVRKDHPVIRFRGEIDALEAAVIESAFVFQRLGLPALAQEMEEILQFLRQVLRCEVLSLPLPEIQLLGMTEEDIHVRSHEPQRFYGLGHFSPAPEHGEAVARLNLLRTLTRRAELAAYDACKDAHGLLPQREELLRALNRLSSLFYVMMFRVLTREYQHEE